MPAPLKSPPTRRGLRARLAGTLAICGLLLVAAAPAGAARPVVPFGFMGVVVDPQLLFSESAATLDTQYALMARNGVESIRTNFLWSQANPAPGVYDWSVTDRAVTSASRFGLRILPIVQFTPGWAASDPDDASIRPPADYGSFTTFMQAATQRYGPTGSFWVEHPELKRNPIREWQIWNEPAANYNWKSTPWYRTYVKLLRAGHDGVKGVDRSAKIVAAAVVGLDNKRTPWSELEDLYRVGARRYMDVVAVNSFTRALNTEGASAAVTRNLEIYRRVRRVMIRRGDARKPIYNTEVTWTAALGKIPRSRQLGPETTARGQAQRLTTYYNRVGRGRKYGIARVYWYTWFSVYAPRSRDFMAPTFQYAGLTLHRDVGAPFTAKPLLRTYANVAAGLRGCRKATDARVCR